MGAGADVVRRHAQAPGQRVLERAGSIAQQYPVLRPLRPGQRRLHTAHVERERVGEHRLGRRVAPQALRAAIGLDKTDPRFVAAGEAHVVERHLIDREEAAGGAVFGGHVGDGGAVGQRHAVQPVAVELDELADHALLSQHLGHGQHEVGGGRTLRQPAGQLEADHVGDQHGDRLAQHRRLRLDAAHAPAQHAEAVDHRGVAVGAEQRVGIGVFAAVHGRGPHRLRQVFQVDLMADAGAGRHHAEIVERGLAPAQEGVALAVAAELLLDIARQRVLAREHIHHHRMVDHQIDRHQRVDLGGLAAEREDAVAHGREVHDSGNAGKVLHQDAGRAERHLALRGSGVEPGGDRLRIRPAAAIEAQHVLQQHL